MAGIKLLCVRWKHAKSDVIRQYLSELSRFLFYCSRYLSFLKGKNIDIALAITLVYIPYRIMIEQPDT